MRRLIAPVGNVREADDVDLTPMLDVVFILLIFFVVTASFVRDAGVPANRSEDAVEQKPDAEAILIEIYPSNEIRINGRIIDLRAVRPNLEQLHAVNPDQPVVIRTSASSLTQTLVSVLDAAKLAEIDKVSVGPLEQNLIL